MIAAALELFVRDVVQGGLRVARHNQHGTLSVTHLRAFAESEDIYDFTHPSFPATDADLRALAMPDGMRMRRREGEESPRAGPDHEEAADGDRKGEGKGKDGDGTSSEPVDERTTREKEDPAGVSGSHNVGGDGRRKEGEENREETKPRGEVTVPVLDQEGEIEVVEMHPPPAKRVKVKDGCDGG